MSWERLQEENTRYRAALETIMRGAGPFSVDPLTFAENVIRESVQTARDALAASTPRCSSTHPDGDRLRCESDVGHEGEHSFGHWEIVARTRWSDPAVGTLKPEGPV